MSRSLFQRWALRLAPGGEDPFNQQARTKIGLLEGWISVVSNTVLAAAKTWLALLSGSLSLLADAFHTFADSFTSMIVIFGFRMSRKPADTEHPFGHGRVESIASLVIGVLLGVTSVELGRASFDRLLHPSPVMAPVWLILVVAFMAVVKEALARFSFDLGRLIQSDTLEADAWHHRSDVYATWLVVMAFVAARLGLLWLDGVAGLGVAGMIGWAALRIAKGAASLLIGEPVSEETLRKVTEMAKGVEGVLGVHEIVMQQYGVRGVLSLHVEVSRDKTVVEAHEVSQAVEKCLAEDLYAHVTVHVDPQGAYHEETKEIRRIVESEVEQIPNCSGFHDLRIERQIGGLLRVRLDVTSFQDPSDQEREEYQKRIQHRISAHFPRAEVFVDIDPPFCADDPGGS